MFGRLIDIIKKRRRKAWLRHAMGYVTCGRSEFAETFGLRVDEPQSGKPYLVVGDDCLVGGTFVFETSEGRVTIGDGSYIGASTFISRSSITVGNHVTIAWGAWFYDHNAHSLDFMERRKDQALQLENIRRGRSLSQGKDWSVVDSKPITLCDDVWVGMNAIILKGVTIGQGAVVGAGSVVTKDVAPWTVVAGNPACVVKQLK